MVHNKHTYRRHRTGDTDNIQYIYIYSKDIYIYSTYIYIYSTYIINIHTGDTGPATQTSMRRRMKRTLNITTRTPPPPAEKMGLGQVGVGTGQGGWVGRLVLVWDWSAEVVRQMRAMEEKRGEGQEEGTQEVRRP